MSSSVVPVAVSGMTWLSSTQDWLVDAASRVLQPDPLANAAAAGTLGPGRMVVDKIPTSNGLAGAMDMSKLKYYRLAHTVEGMRLIHFRPAAPGLGPESILLGVAVSGFLGSVHTTSRWMRSELSGPQALGQITRSFASGGAVGCFYWLVLNLLGLGGGYVQPVRALCSSVLLHPVPGLLGGIGSLWLLMRYNQLQRCVISREQFNSDMVVCCSAQLASVASVAASAYAGLSPALVPLGGACGALGGAGLVWGLHGALTTARRDYSRAAMVRIATSVLGIPSHAPKLLTKRRVVHRFRTLCRYAHPDHNDSAQAQHVFELLVLARDVLLWHLQHTQDLPSEAQGHLNVRMDALLQRLLDKT